MPAPDDQRARTELEGAVAELRRLPAFRRFLAALLEGLDASEFEIAPSSPDEQAVNKGEAYFVLKSLSKELHDENLPLGVIGRSHVIREIRRAMDLISGEGGQHG